MIPRRYKQQAVFKTTSKNGVGNKCVVVNAYLGKVTSFMGHALAGDCVMIIDIGPGSVRLKVLI